MRKNYTDPIVKFSIAVIGLVITFAVLKDLKQIFLPLIIAYFLYFLFEPINKWLAKKKIPFALRIVTDFIIIFSFFWGISRMILTQFSKFGAELPVYEQKLNSIVSSTASSFGITDPLLINFKVKEILQTLDFAGLAEGFFSSTLTIFSTSFFVMLFFVFILSGHEKIFSVIKNRYIESNLSSHIRKEKKKQKKSDSNPKPDEEIIDKVKRNKGEAIENTFKSITSKVQRYIITKFLISVLTGLLTGLVLWLFNVDFILVWIVMTILFNFIPNIGSIIAVILPTIMALVQFESVPYALLIAGIIAVVQNLVGNIVEPKIMGDRLGLNPLVILISLLLWGYIWGLTGMFIAVPLTAVIKIILSSSDDKSMRFISELMGN